MAAAARSVAKRFADASIGPDALCQAGLVMSSARADAINRDGLEAQSGYLLEAYGPDELFARFSQCGRPRGSATDNCRSAGREVSTAEPKPATGAE